MKNNRLLWIALLIWAATFFIFRPQHKPAELPKPQVMLQEAQKLEQSAGDDQDKLQKAVQAYQALAREKKYKNTEYAAEAQLHIGMLQETKLHQQPNSVLRWFGLAHETDEPQKQNAIMTYKALVSKFDPDDSEAAEQAERRLQALQAQVNQDNSDKLLYKVIDYTVKALGANPKYSYALALLVITIAFKALTTPLSRLQFKYMREMQKIQPLVKELQAKYKDNQKEFGPKLMELYKEHGVNPFSSCLPILVQLPVLYLLYYMVRLYETQFANAEFLWIGSSLAERFPSIIGSSLAQPDIPLLLIYTVSMIVSQRISIVDPSQAEQQKIMAYAMPVVFAFIFRSFPAAFMLYWLFFNIISTTQQYFILRQPVTPEGPPTTGQGGGPSGGEPVREQPEKPKKRPTASPGAKAKSRKKKFSTGGVKHSAPGIPPGKVQAPALC